MNSYPTMIAVLTAVSFMPIADAAAAQLKAGVAKVDITNRDVGPVYDTMYSKALVLSDGKTKAVIITMDVVSVGQIGHIKNDFLGNIRTQLEKEFGIPPSNVMINTSHCHGIPCDDVEQRTIQAVREAAKELVPVDVGTGIGEEKRVSENRRIKLKNGKEADVRHAYSMPFDEDVAEVGPIDPEIGIIRLDRKDGRTLAVVYNFAVHPIMGAPNGGNTADLTGFSSLLIEDTLGDGAIAFFLQGCGGDINPVMYKNPDVPQDCEPLGNMLGLSTMRGVRKIKCQADVDFKVIRETMDLPRADLADRIASLEAEQLALMGSLGGTSLTLKAFIPLAVKYNVSGEFPNYYSHRYLQDEMIGRTDWVTLDERNKLKMEAYVKNIHTMEQMTRNNANLALLRMHQKQNIDAGKRTVEVEMLGWRIGDFVMLTFPGELTVRIGLNIKSNSPHDATFVSAYTNGYIYYCPTADQLKNVGYAQEDSDCILAPEWQELYETRAAEMLKKL
ncbi:MAG: hypothetical protein ACKVT0_12610 [Planctomycetaceae bacterium]